MWLLGCTVRSSLTVCPVLCSVCLLQLSETLEDVTVRASTDLSVTVTSKTATHSWTFTVTSKVCIAICLQYLLIYCYNAVIYLL